MVIEASGEARKGRAQAAPENCKKDQDICTMEQFMHESVRKELRFKVYLTDSFSRGLRESSLLAAQRGRLWLLL